ncbi:hypothetical protein PR202_gb15781 [Eleusine coracana subsp. coracana]|uniref:Heparan-alpha-glucosaminide N-acetyltransferase catalytic domain-containing protein n=1 Tax=Eleusine coracana subsp. coracana TaxID=191504 RepID=A0AAV5F010_ELECO|nr:hypothetical protein PR202_gb15781 [Eleusine coracana subsp. coracana]
MGAAANAGSAAAMGGYERVRSDDAPALAVDLEAGHGDYPKVRRSKAGADRPSNSPAPARQRLVSLDVFRGITVLLMIIVDDAGAFLPEINHSPWDGVTVADFVMPFFLFIVGVALALAYKRIAVAYLLTALCEIWLKGDEDVDYGFDLLKRYRYQFIDSPQNGPLPHDAPSWCQAPFDPEGLLSSVMAIVTCLIGLQYGHVIVHFQKHRERIMNWLIPSFSMLVLAFALDFFGMHMNKPLYTVSYTLATAGAAGLLFAGIYALVDLYGYRRPTVAMEWMGTHALMIYVLIACNILPIFIHGFYWKEPKNNILKFIGIGA